MFPELSSKKIDTSEWITLSKICLDDDQGLEFFNQFLFLWLAQERSETSDPLGLPLTQFHLVK